MYKEKVNDYLILWYFHKNKNLTSLKILEFRIYYYILNINFNLKIQSIIKNAQELKIGFVMKKVLDLWLTLRKIYICNFTYIYKFLTHPSVEDKKNKNLELLMSVSNKTRKRELKEIISIYIRQRKFWIFKY